jgi:hypothetical protein
MGDDAIEHPGEIPARRRFVRLPVSLPVVTQATQFGETGLRGMVRTVSAGGLTVEFPTSLAPNTVLTLVLQTRQGPLEVEGRVVWSRAIGSTVWHGFVFNEPKPHEFATDLFLSESR